MIFARHSIALAVLAVLLSGRAALAQPATGQEAALALQAALVDAIAKAEDSVVAIARVSKARGAGVPAFGDEALSPDYIPSAYGTGVVVDARGLILTNYHVLGDVEKYDYYVSYKAAGEATARRTKAEWVEAAEPWTDLAVLKIAADDLKPIKFGDADTLKKGQIVIALGNPHAIARDGQVSATWGIVSNLKRPAPPLGDAAPPADKDTLHHYGNLIQTDARLPTGASGGALVNLKGEMIGLTSSLAALSNGEASGGFAIPVNARFRRDVEALKRGRLPEFGFLGVSLEDAVVRSPTAAQQGAVVSDVVCPPAAGSGLENDDVITRINDRPVQNKNDVFREVGSMSPGEVVELVVVRRGRTVGPIAVTLSKKLPVTARPSYCRIKDPLWRGMQVDYATAVPSEVLNSRRFDIDIGGCVAVVEVEQDSPAWKTGLRRWTFVSHVGETRVADPEAFRQAVSGRSGDVDLRLCSRTGGEVRTVAGP
jgi:S1-C subfamily serine protease